MSIFPTVADVLATHALQIRRFGGSHGLRDPGLLESALFRPQTGYYADTLAEAAALWESLSQNHPFYDGNKRTAFVCMRSFLAINGWALTANDREAQAFVLGLYASAGFRFEALEAWLRQNTARR